VARHRRDGPQASTEEGIAAGWPLYRIGVSRKREGSSPDGRDATSRGRDLQRLGKRRTAGARRAWSGKAGRA